MPRALLVAIAAGALTCAVAEAQRPSPPPQVRVASQADSGYLDNRSNQTQVVYEQYLTFADTTWIQLHFGELVNLPNGSVVRMTGTADGAIQLHTGLSMVEWAGTSAFFNGNEVLLELVAAPNTTGNRVVVDAVSRGLAGVGPDSICGVDNRQLSSDVRQGRLTSGCTGWMIAQDVMLTAGHCTSSGGSSTIEFNVPLSSSGGSVVRSHPDDQYPFTVLGRLSAGIGSDWSVCRVGPNSNHGQLPTQRNGGQWYNLGSVPTSTSGQNIRITGYGTVSSPVSPTWNQVQKTHVGTLAQINPTDLCYQTDTTGGNSGSPVIHENTGNAIGIHTHGGCTSSGSGCNSGTRIDRSDLQNAILAASVTPGALRVFGAGCQGTGMFGTCTSLNGTGGSLSNATAPNEYAYTASTTTPISVTGFSIYAASSSGSSETVGAAIYADAGGTPAPTPLAQTTVTIGPGAGFHMATFATPVAVPAGTFYVAIDHTAGSTYLSNLSSGTPGTGYWRRPAYSGGSWSLSGIISIPSYQIHCQGGGTGGAVPAIAGSGNPLIGRTYNANLALAATNAPCGVLSGFSNTSSPGGPLPFSLAGYGAPGCNIIVSPLFTNTFVTDGFGSASFSVALANNPSFIGFHIYHQWFVLDGGANQLGVAVSNGLDVLIGG